MNGILCADMDNTIIYSYKRNIGENKLNVELYNGTPLYNFLVLKQKHCVLLNKKMPYRSFRCIMSLSKKTL